MAKGYWGKILVVDLSSGKSEEEDLQERLYRDFIGGVGLGVRLLYERQPSKVDPLGDQNILGFFPGLLTGTATPASSRLTVVAKSPLVGGWGDSNIGGHIAAAVKAAGYDAILICGVSPKPVTLLIHQGKVELRDASHVWGKDTVETEAILRKESGDPKLRVACIGPAGEAQSLISSIMTEDGRAAGRSGLGAVMGAKRLKAIAVRGMKKVPVADADHLRELRREFTKQVTGGKLTFIINDLRARGTAGTTENFIAAGATPIKNWSLIGRDSLPSDFKPYGEGVNRYIIRKTGCTGCPIVCGAVIRVEEARDTEYNRPEYETIAGFGTMCLINDFPSIVIANDICNRYGVDTISAATSIAFAIECFQRGVITMEDTDGIELAWGDSRAVLAILEKLVKRQGFGAILADGVKRAAERVGRGSEEWAIHIGGQEPGFHDPRLLPARGTGYICDPTPGRHMAALAATILERGGTLGDYPELHVPKVDLHDYQRKRLVYQAAIRLEQVFDSAGLCKFLLLAGIFPLPEYISAATGCDFTPGEMLVTGERIQTLRQLFNFREGIEPRKFQLPRRISEPPLTGPFKELNVDFDTLRRQYYQAMGWDQETGRPLASRVEELGLADLGEPSMES